jgi:hypothetical protein
VPNYIYKCTECDHKEIAELPISFSPKIRLPCDDCYSGHPDEEFTMTRRIGTPSFPTNCNKVFAGDWYKKQYGHELGQGSMDKAQQAEDRKTLEREFRKRTGQ